MMQTRGQFRIWAWARQLSWLLAAVAALLAAGVRYYDGKARDRRIEIDRMGDERLYLEGLSRDFVRVLDDVAVASASNGALRVVLQESGYQVNLTSSGSVPAPGRMP